MINFKDWLELREMSASGRRKLQAALGLAPPVADIFSRSTPPPWQVERLEKALKKSKKKKKRKKIEEAKKKQPVVHNDIDSFIKSVEMLAKDVWELDLLKKKKSAEEKMAQIAKRNTGSKKPEKPKSDEKPEPEKQDNLEPKEKEKDVAKPTARKRIKTVERPDEPIGKPEPAKPGRSAKPKPRPKLRPDDEEEAGS
jgi:hypothetical protein